jgi:hypothetical protein
MLAAILTLATEAAGEEESSKTAFYLAGGALAVWAVLVAALGIRQHQNWPASKGLRSGLIGLSALLVAATVAASLLTA